MSPLVRCLILAVWIKIIFSSDVSSPSATPNGENAISSNMGSPCVTPSGENATCVILSSCRAIMEALKAKDEGALSFYYQSLCDSADMICCGSTGSLYSAGPSNVLPKGRACGVEYLGDRITNGEVTELNEFPWMALLGYVNKTDSKIEFNCGGTLINARYVLTAAHCIPKSKSSVKILSIVRLGEWRISTEIDCDNVGRPNEVCIDPVLDVGIEAQISHPKYSKRTKDNDIGLLRLERNIKYTKSIFPICLPNADEPKLSVGHWLQVTGWGLIENGSRSDYLLKGFVNVVSIENCLEKVRIGGDVTENQVCAGGKNGIDSCKGDSGGPLMRSIGESEMHWYQEGIVSWGIACGRKNSPGVYTRVYKYHTWILNNIF